jgi:hypothetical protein
MGAFGNRKALRLLSKGVRWTLYHLSSLTYLAMGAYEYLGYSDALTGEPGRPYSSSFRGQLREAFLASLDRPRTHWRLAHGRRASTNSLLCFDDDFKGARKEVKRYFRRGGGIGKRNRETQKVKSAVNAPCFSSTPKQGSEETAFACKSAFFFGLRKSRPLGERPSFIR